jgi:hypothetical protein
MRDLGYLDILGVRFQLIEEKRLKAGDWGLCDLSRARISIARGLDPDVALLTLYHEVIHAIEQTLSLNLTEEQIDGLAAGVANIPQLSIEPGR